MEANSTNETGKRIVLESLSKEELVKRCERLLILAQKAKQAKDLLQEENDGLKTKLTKAESTNNGDVTSEIIENLTQQKLQHVTTIEDLRKQNLVLNNNLQKCNEQLQVCEDRNNTLDSENVSFKRQVKRLTDENEELISQLEALEKQMEECKKLGLEQQNQLLILEKNRQILEDANKKLQNDTTANNKVKELEKMLSINLQEIKKLQSDNSALVDKVDVLKTNLSEKDKNIVTISEELQVKIKLVEDLRMQVVDLQNNGQSQMIVDENDTLKGQNEDLREKIERLTKEIDELNSFQQNFQVKTEKSIKELDETNDRLREKVKSYHAKIVKLAGNVKTVRESKDEIFSLFKTYTHQAEEWRSQLEAASHNLCQYINSITAQNAEYLNENKTLRESNAKFIEQLEAHKTDDEKSKELNEFEHIKSENKRLTEEIGKLLEVQSEYKNRIEVLTGEKNIISKKLEYLVEKHQEELKVFDDQSRKDNNKIEENEKICIEYRKVISKLEEDLNLNIRKMEELQQKNFSLQEALDHTKDTERQIANRTSEEILKLVQENTELLEANRKLREKHDNAKEVECQTGDNSSELEEAITSLRRENSELLTEMNEMNQALKERGETISKFQAHCEEIMKKLQIYETQANRNVDNISHKEEIIKKLEQEVEKLKQQGNRVESTSTVDLNEAEDIVGKKNLEITQLKNEIESLKERINANLECSYAESESMSTSTISRSEETNRLKDLEGSWEERYGKLRTLAVKLKGKIRELSNELVKEQNEKNDVQQKCASHIKTISTLQAQCDQLQDELDTSKKQIKEISSQLDSTAIEICKDKRKLLDNEEVISRLKKEIDDLNHEKMNTEAWKKQISNKVQAFRKELEANKVLKKEFEAKIAKLTTELEAKEQALKAESDGHQQTKNSLEHSNNERKKHSVLNLEMQDYERSVKELSQKLDKRQEEINKLKSQLDSQKSTANAIREQNKLLEEQSEELKKDFTSAQLEISNYKKQVSDLEDVVLQKDNKIHNLTQILESARAENEELSTELSKVIAEHQKINSSLKSEKEHLRSQVLGLQQTLREVQDTLKLKEDEFEIIQNDYDNYKVRAQSVLRQSQNRDVGLEEKLSEELEALKSRCDTLMSELKDYKDSVDVLRKGNETLLQEKNEICGKYEEVSGEVEDLKSLYEQLTSKHQQTVIEHAETVRSLKVHAETLSQCYRQQLSEQEVRHNREIIELQSKVEKAPSPTEMPFPPLTIMHREEGEGSENTETTSKNLMHPVPLERLLGTDTDQEIAFIKKQLSEEESKVSHLTALLADTEQDLAKHVQMNKLLKEEIRRQQRSVEREKHAENLEYLKNVVFKFVTLHSGDERSRLVPVLNTILKLSPEETQKLNMVAKGDPGRWSNYLPLWPSPSKP